MLGDGAVWQKTETFTGIIEGYHLPQACKDEKDPNSSWQAVYPEEDAQMMFGGMEIKGRRLCAFARQLLSSLQTA